MTQKIIQMGFVICAFALLGLLIPTYTLSTAYAAHISPCTKEGLSITIEDVTDHVEINSYSFSVSTPQTNTGSGSQQLGSPQFSNIIIMKTIDENTPKIIEKIARGMNIPKAHIQACYQLGNPNNFATFEIWLEKVNICSYNQEAEKDTLPPIETFELCYGKMSIMYTPPPNPPDPPPGEPNNNDEPTETEIDTQRRG